MSSHPQGLPHREGELRAGSFDRWVSGHLSLGCGTSNNLMTSFPERQVPAATPILRRALSGCPDPAPLGAVGARPAPGCSRGAAHLRSERPREGTASAPRPRRARPCCPRASPASLAGPGRAPAGAARAPGRLASPVAWARGSGRRAGGCRAEGPLPEDGRRATPARLGEGRGARTQDEDSGLPGGTGRVPELGCSRFRAASPTTQPWRVSGLPAQGLLCLPPRPAHRARENRQLPDQDSEEQRGSRARLRRGGSQAGRCGSPELEPRPQPRPQPGAPPAPLTRAGVGRGWRTAAPSRPPQTPAPGPGPSAPHGTPCRHLTVRSGAQSAGVVSLRQRAPLQPWWMPTRENKIKSSGSY